MTGPAAQERDEELRIGQVAARAGTTPRTIRYYEEIGLLAAGPDRAAGAHRVYGAADVERLRELLRLKELLGLSLDELRRVVAAEDARAALREEWHHAGDPGRRAEILREALHHLGLQLELVARRRAQLAELEADLVARRERARTILAALDPRGAR